MLDNAALDLIFRNGRTYTKWLDREVPDSLLIQAYDLAKMGPTSMNCQPLRVYYVRSDEAKEKLRPALDEFNVEKSMTAPATAILALDPAFYEHMPRLFSHFDGARDMFAEDPALAEVTAFRSGTLQAAYFMLACRSLGLDCGPMSGFDQTEVDRLFFADTGYKSNFLCNIGYGDPSALHPRGDRFGFDEACAIL
ncbi:malonic semialdehyde reductase [Aestuariispira insulae]|uniref:3-hydroxypropanoate dehydrogenase n=1 Tax=Aestuariispira insulae TaxID=1461337 RepID=A0A3D9HQA7_9PROT|nr:malonic semialdehyde reductase [Aestuariispira insulae]RED51491.1 3-hydroxypropanoate dehydrogenase [Aestuariispira insulae]